MTYHDPVMLKESTEALKIKKTGIYVDTTYGGGGHSREILNQLSTGKLYAFDQDLESPGQSEKNEKLVFINQNFSFITNFLKMHKALPVDGLIADLGISSHQIDSAGRGFAFRHEGPLDMRMNKNQDLTAEKIVNEYGLDAITKIFRNYGELNNARKLATIIVTQRALTPISTSRQLINCLEDHIPKKHRNKFLAQVFQALRIEVNEELGALKSLLMQCPSVVKKGGRIVFITYHSLEDRLVKNFIRSGKFEGDVNKDFYGNILRPFEAVNRKPISPSDEEIERNNRARSAKLRIAERT